MTPDAVDAPTTYTSTCKMWSFKAAAANTTDKAADAITGVISAAANIAGSTEEDEAGAEGSMNLAVSVATTMAITMLMY